MSKFDSLQLRSYLLGTLAEGQEALEEQLMTDDVLFEILEAEEEELIQNYADGELSNTEVEQFESVFLMTRERCAKIEFAKALNYKFDESKGQKTASPADASRISIESDTNFWTKFLLRRIPVFGAILSVALLVVIVFQFFAVGSQSELEKHYAELNKSGFSSPDALTKFSVVELISGISRGPSNTIRLSNAGDIDSVLFRLAIPQEVNGRVFHIKLTNAEKVIFIQESIRAGRFDSGSEIRLLLPFSVLKPGEYQLEAISGESQEFSFSFVVGK